MRVLIATNELQGTARGDYAWTVEGELVTPLVSECSSGALCGCARGFPGLASSKATTTAMIVERPAVTEADLRDAVHDYLERSGWIALLHETADCPDCTAMRTASGCHLDDVDEVIASLIDEHVELIGELCDAFPVGTVVQRRGTRFSARTVPFAA
jgi:hypothetical protein